MGKYSDTLMEHFTSPRNCGPLDPADFVGHAGVPGKGPFLILYLNVSNGEIAESRFQTYGCGSTIAAGSVLTELISRRPVPECLVLTAETLIDALDGVPPDKLHGPALAIAALRDALNDFSANGSS